MERGALPEALPSLADYAAQARAPSGPGLECPDWACGHFLVVYTCRKPGHVERRRQCWNCGRRIAAWERDVGREVDRPGGR